MTAPDPRVEVAAQWWAARLQRNEHREAFKAALAEHLPALFAQGRIVLQVDYDPKGALLDAVRTAGIECRGEWFSADGLLPRKTRMAVDEGRITVCEGYAAPWVTIWGAPEDET